MVELPDSEASVSKGGNEVIIERGEEGLYVFYFTYRGVLDNYAGFLLVPEGGDPRRYSDIEHGGARQVQRFGGRWYFVSQS